MGTFKNVNVYAADPPELLLLLQQRMTLASPLGHISNMRSCTLLSLLTLFIGQTCSTTTSSPKVKWGECPSQTPPGVECGTIRVPLTYESGSSIEAAGKQTVKLGLTRINATGSNSRGPLFTDFGGPGTPASTIVAAGKFVANLGFSKDVYDTYDVIGLDQRGVGLSQPVKCDPDIFNERVPTFVDSTESFYALRNHSRKLGESCAEMTGELINYLDEVHVAKDYEVVRRALGADKFDYFGLSYGTFAGSTYVSLFPKNVGRMALDGIVDHSQGMVSALLTEASTYEVTLNQFFEWCDRNSSCALQGQDSRKIFDSLLSNATKSPLPAPGCKGTCQPNVTAEDMLYNVQDFLEFVDFKEAPNWIDLGGILAEAAQGNATGLSTALATSDTSDSIQGSPFTYLAIGCSEWNHNASDAQDIEQRLDAIRPVAPQTRGASQTFYYQSTCLGWPAKFSNPQHSYNETVMEEAPPVLLSHSVYDPACSPVWADGLREQMPNAVSITRNGTGHTSHFLLGETRRVIDEYLATGKLPKDGAVYST